MNCYDLHKDVFPSRLLVTFIKDDEKYAFTIGVGMFSMPNADRYYPDYEDYARCEFAIHYPLDTLSEEEEMDLYASLAGLCGLPWHDIDCVGHGHTMDIAVKGRQHCILLDDDASSHPLPLSIKEDKVHLYWLKTITAEVLRLTKAEEAKEALLTSLCQDSSL